MRSFLLGGDLSDPQSLNRYAYVQNDPLNLLDPTGRSTQFKVRGRAAKMVGRAATKVSGVFLAFEAGYEVGTAIGCAVF